MYDSFIVSDYNSFSDIINQLISLECIDEQALFNEHFEYLNEYLNKINVKSYVIEPKYIDRDYIEDYTRYYAKCFKNYYKSCSRILFFKKQFSRETIENEIVRCKKNIIKSLQNNFVGFIVVRPLPKTFLGKVCLKTIDHNKFNCIYPVLREYKIHFLGIELTVNSLAFQEQDNAIAACATSALWTALHAMGYNWGKFNISSPSEITFNAKQITSDYSKSFFPNKGLQPSQMAHAIKMEGFEPLLCNFVNTSYFKAILRGYMQARIPIIIGITLAYLDENGVTKEGIRRNIPIGFHAVTINGYNIDNSIKIKRFDTGNIKTHLSVNDNSQLFMYSSRINKIFVHDDKLGPFISMEFLNEFYQRLETHWNDYKNPTDKINANINTILIPIYPKIRIKFHHIFSVINDFNMYYMEWWKDNNICVEWDIHLSTVCDLKKEWLNMKIKDFEDLNIKIKLLKLYMPKFIWVANAIKSSTNKIIFSFLFDATDIENSDLTVAIIHFSKESYIINCLQALLANKYNIDRPNNIFNNQSRRILSHYLNDSTKIIKPECGFESIKDLEIMIATDK